MNGEEDVSAEYEALLQFVYMAPVGIVQVTNDGTVVMMNPTSAQLLLTIAPDGTLDNLFTALAPVVPGLRELVSRDSTAIGPLCQDLRANIPPPDSREKDPRVLSLSLIRLDSTRVMALLSDVSLVAKRERELREKETWHKASLQLALDAAQTANKAKSEFLANISHELRTPMHAISSFAKLGHGKSSDAPREKLQRYFENIDGSASRLNRLLTDLLDLAKIESGKMTFNMTRSDVGRTLAATMAEFEAMAHDHGVSLIGAGDLPVAYASIDEARMRQVFANLLSNAIKFSPKGGTVSVALRQGTAESGDECVSVSVCDEGPGIPPDELEAVFDKFVQSTKTKTGAGGTGLGLPIAREIVAAHKGRIWAANRPDRGTEFRLDIPLGVATADRNERLVA